MTPVKPIVAGLALLLAAPQARAEYRSVLVLVTQGKDDKTSVTIHSDEKEDRRSAASVDEAVKAVGAMKGWGSTVGVYLVADRGVRLSDKKKLLAAVNDNVWLELEYFGRVVPKVAEDSFLRTGGDAPPLRPPSRMTVSLPGTVTRGQPVPLKLTFANEGGRKQTYANSDFAIALLDEDGRHVPDAFRREAALRDVVLEGKAPEYGPPLAFNPDCKGLTVGKRYQLVCVLPTGGALALAGSARFTLAE